MLQNKVASAAFLIAGLTFAFPLHAQTPVCAGDVVHFNTAQGVASFHVEIADDDAERAQGLMYRRELAADAGMLFIYDSPRRTSFWMRNTYIPLDLVFMDAAGVIRHIHRNARPMDETSIPGAAIGDPQPERLMILEIAAGQADAHGLKVGQPMAYPRLNPDRAAWPCD